MPTDQDQNEDIIAFLRISDEYGEDDPVEGARDCRDLVNHSTVEEGEVSGLKPDPVIFDPVLSGICVERPGFHVGLDLGGP